MGQELANASVPDEIIQALRVGRLTPLLKPSGGVRGIVTGDIIRRLVARTVSRQIGPSIETGTLDPCWNRMRVPRSSSPHGQ